MKNLNAEKIKKGLKCCSEDTADCHNCPYSEFTEGNCFDNAKKDALALITSQEQRIKELSAKVAKWEEECDLRGDMWCKLNEENKRLTEENERLRDNLERTEKALITCDKAHNALFTDTFRIEAEAKADTVRKMQERFIAEIEQTPNANEHFIKAWKSKIDKIAKEVLEGKNEIKTNSEHS